MKIRRSGDTDTAALGELRWRWREEEGRPFFMTRAAFDTAFRRWCLDHRHSHLGWLADDEAGQPVGMAWLAILERIPGPDAWPRLSGSLQSVYVLPAARNAGAGAALVAAVVAEARARALSYVVVHPSERSFPLYRRAGFSESGHVLELRDL